MQKIWICSFDAAPDNNVALDNDKIASDNVTDVAKHSDELLDSAKNVAKGARKADIGSKLDYVFGKATGNAYNIQRSQSMMNELKRIGVHDTPANRALLQSHFDDVINNPNNILGTELRSYTVNGQTFEYTATIRESFFMGPGGGVKVESVWDGTRLLTTIIKGGN